MADLNKLVDELSNMTLLEAAQLATMLREKWGIEERVSPIMQGPNRVVEEIEKAVEKEYFDVVIKAVGPRKIEVIKVVRQLTQLGLKEAKDLVETKDAKVLQEVVQSVAGNAQAALIEAGAEVELV